MEIKLPEKLYYNIGEISKAFNVNPSLLRFWEKEFDILNPKKTIKGTRKYNSVDIKGLEPSCVSCLFCVSCLLPITFSNF